MANSVSSSPSRASRISFPCSIVVFTIGVGFAVGSLPMFAAPVLLFATANWVHIPFEEAKMRRQFGAEFGAYASQVRRWI